MSKINERKLEIKIYNKINYDEEVVNKDIKEIIQEAMMVIYRCLYWEIVDDNGKFKFKNDILRLKIARRYNVLKNYRRTAEDFVVKECTVR